MSLLVINPCFDNYDNQTITSQGEASPVSRNKKKGDISVIVAPSLKPGEELTDIPDIDGGSDTVEIKTK